MPQCKLCDEKYFTVVNGYAEKLCPACMSKDDNTEFVGQLVSLEEECQDLQRLLNNLPPVKFGYAEWSFCKGMWKLLMRVWDGKDGAETVWYTDHKGALPPSAIVACCKGQESISIWFLKNSDAHDAHSVHRIGSHIHIPCAGLANSSVTHTYNIGIPEAQFIWNYSKHYLKSLPVCR